MTSDNPPSAPLFYGEIDEAMAYLGLRRTADVGLAVVKLALKVKALEQRLDASRPLPSE